MNTHSNRDIRRDELLMDRALMGLNASESQELQKLLSHSQSPADTEIYDRLAACLDPVWLEDSVPALPVSLRNRIRAAAPSYLKQPARTPAPTSGQRDITRRGGSANAAMQGLPELPSTTSRSTEARLHRVQFRERLAWLVAAAAVLYAAFAGLPGGGTKELAARRQYLMQTAPDLIQVSWKATDDPAASDAGGDLIWSPASQEGYMTFRGLAANDPRREQYQLWLVDPERDDKYPVDGGVFDVTSQQGEVIVPIRAKLRVDQPTQFVITVEQPGGVVVSRQQRPALLAAAGP